MGVVSQVLAAERVPTRPRIMLAVLAGCMAGTATIQQSVRSYPRDFGQVWFAARSLLHGVNPYPLVGPGLAYDWAYPLLYPLPAGVVAIPFAALSLTAACVLFSVLAAAAFGWALMEHGYGPLFGVVGASLRYASETVQWSPLFAAAVVVPWLQLFLVAKPTIGFAIAAARPSRWAVVGAVIFGGVAFGVQPTWVHDWIAAVAQNNAAWAPARPYRFPLLFPGGFLALLCLLRWRRPEARLVAVLACIPQTPLLYETVPLFLVPRTFWQSAVLVAGSYTVHALAAWIAPLYQEQRMDATGPLLVALLYLPCTLMVLRRPNEGTIPAWLEDRLRVLPGWLKGRAVARA